MTADFTTSPTTKNMNHSNKIYLGHHHSILVRDSRLADTRMEDSKVLEGELADNHGNSSEKSHDPYCEAIGSLIYFLTGTRPDLAFAIGQLTQFYDSPGSAQWNDVKCVLHYLNRRRNFEVCFSGFGQEDKCGYSNSNWCGYTRY